MSLSVELTLYNRLKKYMNCSQVASKNTYLKTQKLTQRVV